MRRSLVALALLAALPNISHAAAVEHSGTPLSSLPALGHYGLDVPAKRGLKALTPEGWSIYLHKDAKLPGFVAWTPTDTWLSALQAVSDKSDLTVSVDWNSRSIYVKNAAEAPLHVPIVESLMATTTQERQPTANAAPTSASTASPSSTTASKPIALETAFRDAAAEHGYSVNWAAGPLEAAAVPSLEGLPIAQAMEKMATLVSGKASVTVDTVTRTVDVLPGKGAYKVASAAPQVVLTIQEGGLMSLALGSLATQAGWTLRWEAPDDFEAAAESTLSGADFRAVLDKALVRMGLQAEWYLASKVAVVVKKY